jgi:hypothetical protein
MRMILYVYCIDEDGLRRIIRARTATLSEQYIFFKYLAGVKNERS